MAAGLIAPFSTSPAVAMGDKVSVKLQGRFSDGTVFDEQKAFAFIVGNGEMLQGVDEAVVGMATGSKKTVIVPPEKGFGHRNEERRVELNRHELKLPQEQNEQLQEGTRLSFGTGQSALITKLSDDSISLDLNHPMAGVELHFDIEVVQHKPFCELSVEEAPVIPKGTSQEGDGKTFPQRGDRLKMHYVGTLADGGTQFDSSRDRNEPFEFQIGVGQVIRGWDEGVMRMSVGQRAMLYVPSVKAYGSSGAGQVIPPNADLIFDVELLEIVRL